jgi:hypothetical protein
LAKTYADDTAPAGWCLGMIGYVAPVASIFPSIKGSADFKEPRSALPRRARVLFGLGQGRRHHLGCRVHSAKPS